MKKTLVWVLVAANVALAGTLGLRGIASNTANAQANPPAARGKYIMIPGESTSSSAVIYLFDSANARIGAMAPDARDTLQSMPTIMLKPIFDAAAAGQTPATGNGSGNNNNNSGNANTNRPGGRAR